MTTPAPPRAHATSALARLRERTASAHVLIIVYYRGVWDPFCVSWGRGMAHMRSLPARLEALRAHLVFVSSHPQSCEREAATNFHFGADHPARRAGRVHFVNDEDLELVRFANATFDANIVVLPGDPNFAGGYNYRNGIIQPGIVALAAPWTDHVEVIEKLSFKHGDGGPNADVLDRPPACSVIRAIERAAVGSLAFCS
jgi:hypothetical protein